MEKAWEELLESQLARAAQWRGASRPKIQDDEWPMEWHIANRWRCARGHVTIGYSHFATCRVCNKDGVHDTAVVRTSPQDESDTDCWNLRAEKTESHAVELEAERDIARGYAGEHVMKRTELDAENETLRERVAKLEGDLARGMPSSATCDSLPPRDGKSYRVFFRSHVVRYETGPNRWVSGVVHYTGDLDDGSNAGWEGLNADGWLPEPDQSGKCES